VKIAALVIAAIIALALLWHGGELHYIGCVKAADARYEPLKRPGAKKPGLSLNGTSHFKPPVDVTAHARAQAVAGCFRLP
jgi:hypothetical protein